MNYDLRERAHAVLKAEMADAAFDLILRKGYDNLTADDIAQHLGVSRPTFYRYLGSKDEVIVATMLEPAGQFASALRATPQQEGDSLWGRLRAAFEPAVLLAEEFPKRQRERLRLVQSLPDVGAKLRRARAPQIEDLADALLNEGAKVFAAHVLASAAMAVLDQSWVQWARDEKATLRALLDRAFAELEAAAHPHRSPE